MKQVDGNEFQVAKRTIAATKLQEQDALLSVYILKEESYVVLKTKKGYFLKFSLLEIPEKKKGAVGVRGMKLQAQDELEQVYFMDEGIEKTALYNDKEVFLNRLKMAKRDGSGTKARK